MENIPHNITGEKMESGLCEWREQLISEIEKHDTRIRELQSQRAVAYQKLKHVDALLGISTTTGEMRGGGRKRRSSVLLDGCERILRASSEPMHVEVLAQRLSDNDIPLPGSGTVGNLVTRLWRSPRFKRVAPGTYIPC
jgi:hypothetical protein